MDFNDDHSAKLLRAQIHIFNQTFSFISSMSLKCAIDLCIPDIIHKYGQPIPLSRLIASLPIHPSKTCFVYRLMQILTHSGFFSKCNVTENELEVSYELTDASRLLLKDHPMSMTSLLQLALDPILMNPCHQFSTWFTNEDPTPFHTQNGMTFWDYARREPKLNHLFNDAMTNDTRLISSVVIEKCKGVFKGLESLVDVGGGTGTMVKTIAKSFPQLKCIVFDLPHVIDGMQGTENIKYVVGDMFEAIPSADSIMLKCILHNWNDEECLKILKKCKEAIAYKDKGKVIIIDVVIGNEKGDSELDETKLFYDMEMMVLVTGKERSEKDWVKLIFSAGFNSYKITPILGLKSLIEVYP
ncbi:putative O-methyltransferase 3, partial [Mucuna pruriens]